MAHGFQHAGPDRGGDPGPMGHTSWVNPIFPPSSIRALSGLLMALVLLGGCSTGDDAAPTDPATATTPATDTGTPGTGTDTADTDADAGSDASCLVGRWTVDPAAIAPDLSGLPLPGGGAGDDLETTIDGDAFVEFRADGTFTYTADFVAEADLGGLELTATTIGDLGGTYTAADGVITTAIETDELDFVVRAAGLTVTRETLGLEAADVSPLTDTPFDCSGTTPTIDVSAAGAPVATIELVPA